MRELKFRVWSEEDREYRTDCDVFRLFHGMTGCPATIYNEEGDRFDIEQYTGLKDKNGKEIYEGDLIKVSDAPALKDKTLIVEFGEYYIGEYACTKMSGWLVRVVNSDWTASLLDEIDRCEVVGNIHENPELLEEE